MKKRIPGKIKLILEEVKERLRAIYADRLKDIILYGSYARGDAEDGSDIDIIILLEDMAEPFAEREKYFNAIWELSLKHDTVISVLPFREEDFKTKKLSVALNAKREGVAL